MTHEHWTKAALSDLVTKLEARIAVLQTEALSSKCYFCGNRLPPAQDPRQDDPTRNCYFCGNRLPPAQDPRQDDPTRNCYFCGNRLPPAQDPRQDDPTRSATYPYYRAASLGSPQQTV